jgi:hypothetical protein
MSKVTRALHRLLSVGLGPHTRHSRLVVIRGSARRDRRGVASRRPCPSSQTAPSRSRMFPGGDYYLAAVTDVEARDLQDAGFLGDLSKAAIPVTLRSREQKIQNVRVGG